jgi:hypothetical protein
MTDQCTVLYGHAALILNFYSGIKEYILADLQVLPAICVKRREQ